ncbi:hypothetical protein CXP39_01000 [Mesoplasma syrphidae]|uniref:Lipoprotein n=1 Tax=Mesoplasma syrphidae TaxID=225999 RepID=A0A2K9BMW4_9MOLU|nr:lipoprotein [Mesoplasma syrphidae]AUF83383.1 hypothetical protein CXP39_01000 [Mesoplasma syrphidae]
MRKILTILGAVTITTTSSVPTISCGPEKRVANKKINQSNIKNEVENFLDEHIYNSREEAISALSKSEWKAEGIAYLECTVLSNLLPRSIYVTPILKNNYSWENASDEAFSTVFKMDVSNLIAKKYKNIASNWYLNIEEAETKIKQEFQGVSGIKNVSLQWKDQRSFSVEVKINYEERVSGPLTLSFTLSKKTNLDSKILETLELYKNRKFDSELQLKGALTTGLTQIEGVKSINITTQQKSLNNTLQCNITVEYNNGYGGALLYQKDFLIKIDLTSKIESLLSNLSEQYYDNKIAAETNIEKRLKLIDGIDDVNISSNSVEGSINIFSYNLIVKYFDTDYIGKDTYQSNFKIKTNVSNLIHEKELEFQQEEYDNYLSVETRAKELLESINGIFKAQVIDLNKESSYIHMRLSCDKNFVLDDYEVKWNFKIDFPKISKVADQELSYRNNLITKTVQLTGSKLESKRIVAISANPKIISVSINGLNVTVSAMANVAGIVNTQISLEVANTPETMTSFNVSLQGKPEVEVLDSSLPDLIQMRTGWEKEIDFKLNYFDSNLDTVSAAPSDNDGQTSGQIILKDPSKSIYTLKIKALKGNNISSNGQQKMNILVNESIAKSFATQIHDLPNISSDIDSSSQLAIKTKTTATIKLKLTLNDSKDIVKVRVSDADGIVEPTLTKIDESTYKLEIYGAKSNSWMPIGGNQDVIISINDKDVWKVNTRVR